VEVPLLQRLIEARNPLARAYAAATVAPWADRLPEPFDPLEQLRRLAQDPDSRVRLAALVAAGNIPRREAVELVLTVADQPRDRFIDTALRAAIAVLKPFWQAVLTAGASDWKPEWHETLRTLDDPRPAAPVGTRVTQKKG